MVILDYNQIYLCHNLLLSQLNNRNSLNRLVDNN
nr:MAG TPA: hypothetical protein [Bacteriophage sp.]